MFPRESLRDRFEPTMWRYRPLLPIADHVQPPPLTVGWTPLYEATKLATQLKLHHLWVKDEGRQPTASLKDRASAIAIMKARNNTPQ